jgi:triacylglycerol esterase/lipase EstA (alpha/beta hydrolase family)
MIVLNLPVKKVAHMSWITLPHQLNNRKFTKAIVFVHGLNGSAASWKGAPNRFVDRLSQVRPIYNHFGLYVFQYDPKLFEVNAAWKLIARLPSANEYVQKTTFNTAIKRISAELRASLTELLPGCKTVVLVGHGMGGLVIKRVLAQIADPPKCYYIDTDDTHDAILEVDDTTSHVTYNKLLALLQELSDVNNKDIQ